MVFGFGRSSSSKRSSKGVGGSQSSVPSSLSSASRSSASSRSSSRTGWEYLSDRSSRSSQNSRSSQSSYYSGVSSSTIRPGSSHTVRPAGLTANNMRAYDRASGNRMDDLDSVGAGSSVSQDRYGNPRRSKGSSRSRSRQPASDVTSQSSTSTITPNIVTIRPKGVHANSDLGSVRSNGSSSVNSRSSSSVNSRSSSSVRSRSRAPSRLREIYPDSDSGSPNIQYAAPRGLGMPPARPPTSYPYSDIQSVDSSQSYSDAYSNSYSDTPIGMDMVPQPQSSYTSSDLDSLESSGYGPPAGGATGDVCRQCGSNSVYGAPMPGSGRFPGSGSNITVVVNSSPGPCGAPCSTPCPPPCCGASFSASCSSYGHCC